MNDLRARIARGETTFGSWLNLASEAAAEIMADAGFDWLAIDMEHTTTPFRTTEAMIRIIESRGVAPLVRVGANDPLHIKYVMDAGAAGVIVPMIETAEAARAAVSAVKYPPVGTRGVGIGRAHRYGTEFDSYVSTINDQSVVIVQVEHHRGIKALAEIQAVAGVDATMIGPYDLSASVGKPGKFDDPAVAALLAEYEAVSRASDRVMGYHVVHPDRDVVAARLRAGYRLIGVSVDFLFLGSACRNAVADARSAVARLK